MNIGLAGWAIQRRFRTEEPPLDFLDFFKVAREEFGIDRVEVNNTFMASHDRDYLDKAVKAADDAGVTMEGMAVDGTGSLAELDDVKRAEAVKNAMAYFDVAEGMGLEYFRVNTGGSPEALPEMVEACIDSYRQLAEEAGRRGIKVAIENHGGLSTKPETIVEIIECVGSEHLGTLPDCGNFPEDNLIEDLRKIMPYALNVHVKWSRGDKPGKRDLFAVTRMVNESGFDGTMFIEDGGPIDDHQGVLELKGALLACLNAEL
ncbi:MAG: sugar phosphate isomerase/epimerase family protein [Planctomycetota bacterium]|jgi:sugar phosphate isomerase/epimerase|nr:sugar phosphate isomerase/epimerase family protein [Planctomycetota bacterium]